MAVGREFVYIGFGAERPLAHPPHPTPILPPTNTTPTKPRREKERERETVRVGVPSLRPKRDQVPKMGPRT